MTILDKIVEVKRNEIASARELVSIAQLENSEGFQRKGASLVKSVQEKEWGVITEFKRKSPSRQNINIEANPTEVVTAYQKGGALACSVLTDKDFFGALNDDFSKARQAVALPLLRKEFIVDEYQLYQSKAMGADIILLIAACLTVKETQNLARKAQELGLEVLLELNTEDELHHINPNVDFVGVNNRNLKTFEVDIANSERLGAEIPKDFIKVSESGLSGTEAVSRLRQSDFQLFLMGEHFMKQQNPELALRSFIDTVHEHA